MQLDTGNAEGRMRHTGNTQQYREDARQSISSHTQGSKGFKPIIGDDCEGKSSDSKTRQYRMVCISTNAGNPHSKPLSFASGNTQTPRRVKYVSTRESPCRAFFSRSLFKGIFSIPLRLDQPLKRFQSHILHPPHQLLTNIGATCTQLVRVLQLLRKLKNLSRQQRSSLESLRLDFPLRVLDQR